MGTYTMPLVSENEKARVPSRPLVDTLTAGRQGTRLANVTRRCNGGASLRIRGTP